MTKKPIDLNDKNALESHYNELILKRKLMDSFFDEFLEMFGDTFDRDDLDPKVKRLYSIKIDEYANNETQIRIYERYLNVLSKPN